MCSAAKQWHVLEAESGSNISQHDRPQPWIALRLFVQPSASAHSTENCIGLSAVLGMALQCGSLRGMLAPVHVARRWFTAVVTSCNRGLAEQIRRAADAYYNGTPIMSDEDYDLLLDRLQQLDPDNEILLKVVVVVAGIDDR